MSPLLRSLVQVTKRQGKHLLRALHGQQALTPSFACMTLDLDDVAAARQALAERGRWTDDDVVRHFAATFARWNGSQHASAFASGREALTAAVRALALPEGAEILLPGYTCVAVPNALRFAGCVPRFADIELDTFGLSAQAAERALTPNTRALVIQHTYGLVSRDYEALLDLARRKRLRVIEDCAHATGSTWNGKKVGNRGDVAIYSSEQSKVFCTGQGGLVTTNDQAVATRLIAQWQDAGRCRDEHVEHLLYSLIVGYYQHKAPLRHLLGDVLEIMHARHRLQATSEAELRGERPPEYGRRMSPAIAAQGLVQLEKLEHYAVLRRAAWTRWDEWAQREGRDTPRVLAGSQPAALRYPLLVTPTEKRDTTWVETQLAVPAGVWFATHLHPSTQPVTGCPQADLAVARCINLPTLVA